LRIEYLWYVLGDEHFSRILQELKRTMYWNQCGRIINEYWLNVVQKLDMRVLLKHNTTVQKKNADLNKDDIFSVSR